MIKNEHIQKTLLQDGYAVVGELNEEAFLKLLNSNEYPLLNKDSCFYYSLLNNDYPSNKQIANSYKAVLTPFFEEHFDTYRTITESYLIKPAQTNEELLLHQDWCYTDEKRYQSYNVWIPLEDVTEENGALFFLKGSHLWFNNKRSGSLPTARVNSKNKLILGKTVTVNMKKGEVLLFNPAVFHGSHPNRNVKNRIIVSATILEKSAPFLYYQQTKENEVAVFELSDDAFLEDLQKLALGGVPDSGLISFFQYNHVSITEEMLHEKCVNSK